MNPLCCFRNVDSNNQSMSRNIGTTCECLVPNVQYPVSYWISRNIYITTIVYIGYYSFYIKYPCALGRTIFYFGIPAQVLIQFKPVGQSASFYIVCSLLPITVLLKSEKFFFQKNMDSCHVFVKEEKTDASFQFHLPVDSLSCQVSLSGTFARIWIRIRIQAFTLFRIQIKPWFLLTKN